MDDKAKDLRRALRQSPWFGFDLDDTLHEFRKASGAATTATLTRISNAHQIEISCLKSAYSKILSQGTSGAFSDGKTSHQYRRERFSALLASFSLTATANSPEFLAGLLDTYEHTLTSILELKPDVLDLFVQLRRMGKKIARTIEALGLSDKIDFLATTNRFGVAKVDGLFPRVLAHLDIQATDMVYIGDSQERDMVPAMECGMRTIHYAENENFDPTAVPAKFDTLAKIAHLVSE
ncbi:hypothetical protein EJ05DRAFT_491736 [Pseudovirgaria hyperparasitica]|uniref:HAD-like protein n=1 Tax=Pseudovirgaria hyperparasitica TaxID=470096 RepID=A0A6A6WFW1_9PEZI|nr:uncharacterized protein EJ05DRAFT_491736 [Pseudovirgaria hyperparasitica]KAF2760806.1 hypothetical protein EJ05DRAFT_491736 [Pseudovirgaria hyperparasitica]